MFDVNQLEKAAPFGSKARIANLHPHLVNSTREFGISTPARLAAFFAQLLHESGSFRYMEEIASGNAYDIANNPKLAAKLGNVKPGDGRRYKGRGLIQLTGRSNYKRAGDALGVDLENHPERAASPELACRIASWFWKTNGLNELADQGKFKDITKRINGGYNGLEDRLKHWERCKVAFRA